MIRMLFTDNYGEYSIGTVTGRKRILFSINNMINFLYHTCIYTGRSLKLIDKGEWIAVILSLADWHELLATACSNAQLLWIGKEWVHLFVKGRKTVICCQILATTCLNKQSELPQLVTDCQILKMFKVNCWLLRLHNSVTMTDSCAFTRATASLAFLKQRNCSESVARVNGSLRYAKGSFDTRLVTHGRGWTNIAIYAVSPFLHCFWVYSPMWLLSQITFITNVLTCHNLQYIWLP